MASKREHIHLRNFSEAELMFDEQETKDILKFFFQGDYQAIESLKITNELRNFAQGLLVAAIDASYAMGWVQLIGTWAVNPGSGLRQSLQKLARRAARYWFKHLKRNQSLTDAKIYDSVRGQLAFNFKITFDDMMIAKSQGPREYPLIACINCAPAKPRDRVWG